MAPTPLPLGPFDLTDVAGRGASGEVWRGRHRDHGVEVAIKLLPPAPIGATRADRVFHNEVRQAARLDHPGIVVILDMGVVTAALARDTGGVVPEGSRFIAMEYASQGALDRRPPRTWEAARDLLDQVLSALAHAHARGVLHRDIKPANILLAGPRDLRPGVRLTDFGIAHAWEERAGDEPIPAGTAAFMAPEQVRGDGRSQGPWTDLYALGCVGWWMVCGRAPFGGLSTDEVLQAHLAGVLPPFAPRLSHPDGLAGWLGRLLARRPADRFANAADAAQALRALGEAPLQSALETGDHAAEPPRTTLPDLELNTLPIEIFEEDTAALAARMAPLAAPPSLAPTRLPPWRHPHAQRPAYHLMGAGLSLLGVRALPLVGRDREMDAIWSDLAALLRDRRPRAVRIEGGPGVGKTALSQAVASRAAELGATLTLVATHDPISTPADGLSRMLARHLGLVGLDPTEIEARLPTLEAVHPGLVEAVGAAALVTLLQPSGDQPAGAARFEGAPQSARFTLLLRVLRHLARERPLVLRLEDVHHSAETQTFVSWLLERRADAPPLCCLMTARTGEDGRDATPVPAPGTRVIHLAPLTEDAHLDLISALLPLEPDLARAVAARTEGNPLFAVELVSGWARRALLVAGPAGFALRPGADRSLPEGIEDSWRDRVDRVLAHHLPDSDRQPAHLALGLAATLGRDVDEAEWAAACAHLDLPLPPSLAGALVAGGLAELTPGGLRLCHNLLRESILNELRRRATPPACTAPAPRCWRRAPWARRQDAARIGRHRVAAGDWDRALGPLARAITEAIHEGELGEAEALLEERGAALAALGDRPEAQVVQDLDGLKLLLLRGRFDAGAAEADALVARAQTWPAHQARALRFAGMIAEKQSDLARAEACFEAAEAAARRAGDSEELAASIEHRGTVARRRGFSTAALGHLQEALRLYEALDSPARRADCLTEIGAALIVADDLEAAARTLRQASELYQQAGYPVGRMQSLNNLGDARRRQGRLDEAEVAYRAALGLSERAGTHFGVVIRANLGLTRLAAGRMAQARATLEPCLDEALGGGRRGVAVYLHLALLSCVAEEGDWASFDHHLQAATLLLRELDLADPELQALAEGATQAAKEAGQPQRAATTRALSAGLKARLAAG